MRILSAVLERLLRRPARILNNQTHILERLEDMSEVLDQVKDFAGQFSIDIGLQPTIKIRVPVRQYVDGFAGGKSSDVVLDRPNLIQQSQRIESCQHRPQLQIMASID